MAIKNPGIDFELCYSTWFKDPYANINAYAVNNHVANLCSRREKDKESQIASLLRAITCLDLTTLCGDDTCSNVERLCHKANNPITDKYICSKLGVDPSEIKCAAVCVYPLKVSRCVETLKSLGSNIPVAAVAASFPSGQSHLKPRLNEIECCIEDGAKEIDIVISRDLAICGEWKKLYDEVSKMREASEGALLKTIIAAGELGSLTNVYKASLICMAAGADFIKTSTGKESVNATLPIGAVMARAIEDYCTETNFVVGFKPAGGIRSCKDVFMWQELMAYELNNSWLFPDRFRIGASSLLGDIERTIVKYADASPLLPFL